MKSIPQRLICLLSAGCLISGPVFSLEAFAADSEETKAPQSDPRKAKDRPGRRPPGGDSMHRESDDPFRGLSPEQREKLREAVRRAWSDPAVLQARDELKTAAESYQNTIYAAIKRSNPDMAEAIDILRKNSSSELKTFGSDGMGRGPGGPGGPGGGGGRDWKVVEGFLTMENPSFLRELGPEKQKIYREAHQKALNSSAVKTKLESLRSLREEDETMRKKRIEAIRGVHQAIRRALVEADPRVDEFLPESGGGGPRSGPSGEGDRPSDRPTKRPLPDPASPKKD